ncbi:hypothetical protein [Paenibacillus sp. UNC451MF]|uniref:hypothetical protein n=1 Tax=Paenibacillus sp. UNC451MF TaxID=1449063 RepID=UPI000AB232A4|nr:hypothetical protein [Paenibacillus sp. UNC451MF]
MLPASKLGHPAAGGLNEIAPADLLLIREDGERLVPVALYKEGVQVYGVPKTAFG